MSDILSLTCKLFGSSVFDGRLWDLFLSSSIFGLRRPAVGFIFVFFDLRPSRLFFFRSSIGGWSAKLHKAPIKFHKAPTVAKQLRAPLRPACIVRTDSATIFSCKTLFLVDREIISWVRICTAIRNEDPGVTAWTSWLSLEKKHRIPLNAANQMMKEIICLHLRKSGGQIIRPHGRSWSDEQKQQKAHEWSQQGILWPGDQSQQRNLAKKLRTSSLNKSRHGKSIVAELCGPAPSVKIWIEIEIELLCASVGFIGLHNASWGSIGPHKTS